MRKHDCVPTTLLILLIAVLLAGCGESGSEEDEAPQTVNVETTLPTREKISVSGSFVGTIETGDVVSVYPQISGLVITRNYEVGDYVNAGDTLFIMDDRALQIAKRDADANVKSAAASLEAQKANNTATAAAAAESIGSIPTREYELAKAYNEADREINSNRISQSTYLQQASANSDDLNRADSAIKRASDQESDAKKLYSQLSRKKDIYLSILKADDDTAKAIADKNGVTYDDADQPEEIANKYILQKTRYTGYEELSTATEAANQVIENARTEKNAQEGNYSSSLTQKIEACANAEVAKGNIANAEEAKTLAQKMFMDYELFTKNTVTTAANAQVAEADANVKVSDSQLESARANQALADLNLQNTEVKAPISGIIGEINIEQYGMASDQTPAYVITGQNNKKISFGVPENILHRIKVGQDVEISKDNNVYKAVVTRINDSLNDKSSLFKVEAAIQSNGPDDFIIGTKLKLETAVDDQENALTIPIETLFYDDGKPYVYVVSGDKAVRKDVETGISNKTKIQIISGLEDKDAVITSWSSALKDQTPVKITKASAKVNSDDGEISVVRDKDAQKKPVIDIARVDTAASAKETQKEEKGFIETTDRVNIRETPDKSGVKITTVSAGTRFEKIGEKDGWTKVKHESGEAYIKSDYVRMIGEDAQ